MERIRGRRAGERESRQTFSGELWLKCYRFSMLRGRKTPFKQVSLPGLLRLLMNTFFPVAPSLLGSKSSRYSFLRGQRCDRKPGPPCRLDIHTTDDRHNFLRLAWRLARNVDDDFAGICRTPGGHHLLSSCQRPAIGCVRIRSVTPGNICSPSVEFVVDVDQFDLR